MKLSLLALASSLLVQGGTPSPRDVLRLDRPLSAPEVSRVVGGIHQALAGTTLRLVDTSHRETDILMGRDGRARIVRVRGQGERVARIVSEAGSKRVFALPDIVVSVFEYSDLSVRRCDGRSVESGMVIEYVLNLTTKVRHVIAREPEPRDAAMVRPLEMLRTTDALAIGESRLVGGRNARALVSKMPSSDNVVPTGDPAPDPAEFVPIQSLWVDADSLFPLRWEVFQRQAFLGAADFVYAKLDLQRPAGFDVPTCIP